MEKGLEAIACMELSDYSGAYGGKGKNKSNLIEKLLIKRAVAGDEEAFAVIWRMYEKLIYRKVLKHVHNVSDAQDIVQNIAITLYRFLPSFEFRSNFVTWLWFLIINNVRMWVRKKRTDQLAFPGDDELIDLIHKREIINPTTETYLNHKEVWRYLENFTDLLPEAYRKVFVQILFQDLSGKEVARREHLTVPAVKSRLLRAKQMYLKRFRMSQFREEMI